MNKKNENMENLFNRDSILINNKNINITIWNEETEKLLVDWADKAMCFRWLHSKSCSKYNSWNIWFTIPIIIISTSTGTANFSQDKINESFRDYAAMIIGFFNIVAAILTTIHKFFKVTELSEAHRIASIAWDKFYRKIKIQLAQDPDNRDSTKDFILICQSEYDNLIDSTPYIEPDIIKSFHKTFSGVTFEKWCCKTYIKENNIENMNKHELRRVELAKIMKKPVICDDLESIKDFLFSKDKKRNNAILKFKYLSQKLKEKKIQKNSIIEFIIDYNNNNNELPILDTLIEKFPNYDKSFMNNILKEQTEYMNKIDNVIIEMPDEST
tara:strand:+ start:1388 stop:2368 length:981 start_codon:yes stop_codon:yes gene_type:complete